MVGGAVVTQDVAGTNRLEGDPIPVIVAGVAAGTEDAHQSGLPAAYRAASAKHVGLDMYIVCSKGFKQ